MTAAEFPQYHCDFWVPMMSGYGGNSVLLLPNGATFYIFSDGGEWEWFGAVNEINKIAPFCHGTSLGASRSNTFLPSRPPVAQ